MDSILPNSEPPAAGDAGPDLSSLRLALFSGNYNYVRDGANQALNRLVGYLLRHGAAVRVYSPVVETPAFPATGDLVDVPALPLPGRSEYRIPVALGRRARRDLAAFAPNAVHVSSPDFAGHRAVSWARRRQMAVLASVHTRFDTYPRYYNLAWIEPILTAILRRFYRRCDGLVAPSESMAQVLRDQRMNYDISLWSRGVDRDTFHPGRRDMEWRRSIGIADDHDFVGEGPASAWFQARLPQAVFVGFQGGTDLGRAVASMDVLFNPSVTETFGNVTLEAMACALPVVAAEATGSESLVENHVNGRLIRPGAIHSFAEALRAYVTDPALRARHGAAGELRSHDFSWDRINRAVAETYLRLIRQKRAQR